jgi:hypothetical protein
MNIQYSKNNISNAIMLPTTLLNLDKQINIAVCFVLPAIFVLTGAQEQIRALDIVTMPLKVKYFVLFQCSTKYQVADMNH